MQNLFWPPSGGGSSANPSVGTNGIAIPGSSTLVAGKDPGGLLKPLSVDTAGVLNVAASSLPLPTGAATAALQTSGNASLTSIDSRLANPLPLPTGASTSALQTAGNASLASIDSKLTNPLPVSASSLPLPTGAATSALQSTGNASLASIDAKLTNPLPVSGTVAVSNFPATQPVSGTVAVSNFPATQPISAVSLPLPTGASTSALQTSGNASLTSIDSKLTSPLTVQSNETIGVGTPSRVFVVGGLDSGSSAPSAAFIDGASGGLLTFSQGGTIAASTLGSVPSQFVRNDYSSVNVTTAAYVQLIASTLNGTNVIEIFDSSGQTLKIAFGAAAAEVDQFLVFPGGNGRITCHINAGTRISIKAVSANATVGEFSANLYT